MSEQTRILVVEDNVDLAEMLSTYFHAEGYSVTTASWGEDAIKAVKNTTPDLITLDINLPDIDGYEVCRRLRQIRQTERVPVIFLTEKRQRQDKLAGLELGAVDYITKPFDIQELSLRVGNALHRSQLRTLDNPITGLPEGLIVREKLERMLARSEWAVISVGFEGLDGFRDTYGFVAADDVIRAAGLMIGKALEASDAVMDFLGHIDSGYFLIITTPDRVYQIANKCLVRLETAITYFYPAFDEEGERITTVAEPLSVKATVLRSDESQISDFKELREGLLLAPRFKGTANSPVTI